ncbi:MAG: ribonuclease III domain-containing protein [Promethearchaeota archaeon]|jgi:ribonuclease-3
MAMTKEEKLKKLQDFIEYKFNNEDYLVQSLTTPRLANETGELSYEYLETLGDAVIKLIFILKLHQQGIEDPGEITKIKAILESDNTLKKIANNIKLQNYIFKSGNQQIKGTRILADVFEALCGAIFLDSNHDFNLVEDKLINPFYENIDSIINSSDLNIKSYLLEYLQGKFKTNVKIKLEYDVSGLAHNPTWVAKNPKILDISTKKDLVILPSNIRSKSYGNKPEAKEDIFLKILDYLKNREN